jgi:hypothetical protein
MNIEITDSTGGVLTITTDVHSVVFGATAWSPHADGFTVLSGMIGRRMPRAELELACRQSIEREEVCILPANASPVTRVMIVPNAGALDNAGKEKAAALMMDLFRATQTARVASASLLIKHFGVVQRYPQAHVVGIFDAITELKRQSFLGLRVLGFEVHASIKAEFERDVSQVLPNS